jgi:hypothetical protein
VKRQIIFLSGLMALVFSPHYAAFALSLTLSAEAPKTVGPQSASNPCIIAATTCQQDTNVFDYTDFDSTGNATSYDLLSPIYNVSQLSAVFSGGAFNIAIDVNTADNLENLTLFEVTIDIGGTNSLIYSYTPGSDPIIGSISGNGNGYADWTLRNVLISNLGSTTVQFHAVWSGASDGGESFFLVAGTSENPCTVNCTTEVPEPSALILLCAALVVLPFAARNSLDDNS